MDWLASNFMPHGHCYLWRPSLVFMHALSDAAIAFSYFCIPIIMISYYKSKKDPILHTVVFLYIMFILLCGWSHLNEVINIWHGFYYYSGVIKIATAIVSLLTVYKLYKMRKKLKSVPSLTERMDMSKNLEDINNDLNSAMEHKNKMLIESNKLLKNYARWVSHDLKEPLRNIGNFTDILFERKKDQFDEKDMEFYQYIKSGIERLEDIIHGLLELSTIQAQTMEFSENNIHEIIKAAIDDNHRLLDGIEVHSYVSPDMTINSNRLMMERLFTNLISNAAKFYKKKENHKVEISTEEFENSVEVSIKDNGLGISNKRIKHIFDLHSKGDGPGAGSGIGLTFVKAIADKHGARVEIKSKEGSYTIVSVTFPKNPSLPII